MALKNEIALPLTLVACCTWCCWAAELHSEHQNMANLMKDLVNIRYYKDIKPTSECPGHNISSSAKAPAGQCAFQVRVRIFLIRIHDIVESEESLLSTVRMQVSWDDPALAWDPDKYQGVKSITLKGGTIWKPDLYVANSADTENNIFFNDDFSFRLRSDGRVYWHPTGKLATRCKLDLKYFPFDHQQCAIVVESAVFTSYEMVVIVRPDKPDPVSLGMYAPNEDWELMSTTGFSVTYLSKSTPFSRVHFWITVRRDYLYYENALLVPISLLSIIQMFTFLMPMKEADRVTQATIVLLNALFLLNYLKDRLPKSRHQSLVQMYLTGVIGLSVGTIAVCIITLAMVSPDDGLEWWGVSHFKRQIFGKKRVQVISVRPTSDTSPTILGPRRVVHAAALINLAGFLLSLLFVVLYPLMAFRAYVDSKTPPLPAPPEGNITKSYYADIER